MAKKAAALQSFQKCDVQNLAIPSTIVEDTEFKHNEDLGVVFVETEKEKVLPFYQSDPDAQEESDQRVEKIMGVD